MQTRSFEDWLATFRDSINSYKYYVDFEKIYANVERLKIEVNILNSLINSKNVEAEFERILTKYPECLKVVPILLAVRKAEIFCMDESGAVRYSFDVPNQTIEQYKYFMRETGLFELLEKHLISNLYDYLTGVEVGLDSNGRKNRGGHQMENLVEKFLKAAGVEYSAETYLPEIFPNKRWDFVVRTAENIFALETNFYTDGKGWRSARQNLHETFLVLRDLYNIRDLEGGKFLELFK